MTFGLLATQAHGAELTTYGQFRGILAVAVALAVFVGGPLLILATNVGWRKGAAITLAAFFGYLSIHGFLWMIYPRGPLVTRQIMNLPNSISSRVPAILLMFGAGAIMVLLCIALNRLDRAEE